jgi:peptidoglycan/xylan/chitin deacetylase (PgdA/CDA1 family)
MSVLGKLLSPVLYHGGVYRRRWRNAEPPVRGIALVYHRIAAPAGRGEPPGFGVEQGIPADVFESQIRFMKRHFRPVRAADLAQGETGGDPCFAVTFDDGYADNLEFACPVLERQGVPATIFLTTDWMGTDRRFWWEQLGALLRETTVPRLALQELDPVLRGRWDLPDDLPLGNEAERERAHYWISMGLMRTPPAEIDPTLERIASALEVPLRREERDVPMLDWEGVRALCGRGFEAGAHGRTHANLGLAPDAAQEVRASVDRVAEETGRSPELFAYPYGGPEHRSPEVVEAVRQAGCLAAFTTDEGAVRPDSDRFELPRAGLTRGLDIACAYQIDAVVRGSA